MTAKYETWYSDTYETSLDCARLHSTAFSVNELAEDLPFVQDVTLVDFGFMDKTTGKHIDWQTK